MWYALLRYTVLRRPLLCHTLLCHALLRLALLRDHVLLTLPALLQRLPVRTMPASDPRQATRASLQVLRAGVLQSLWGLLSAASPALRISAS